MVFLRRWGPRGLVKEKNVFRKVVFAGVPERSKGQDLRKYFFPKSVRIELGGEKFVFLAILWLSAFKSSNLFPCM